MKIKLLILLSITNMYGFEVNTHQALTRCAITTNCGTEGTENLKKFVEQANINTNSNYYQKEI